MFLAIGSIGFWLLFAVASVIFIIALEAESIGFAAIGFIGSFAALYFWGDFNVVAYAKENPLMLASLVGGYFVAGTAWAMAKWWFYVKDCRYRYDEAKEEFLSSRGHKGKKIPDELLGRWKEFCEHLWYSSSRSCGDFSNIPQLRENKTRIMHWMMFWPWSFAWTIVNDPFMKLFKRIYRSIQGILQRISDSAYRGVEDDFREASQTPEGGQESELGAVDNKSSKFHRPAVY